MFTSSAAPCACGGKHYARGLCGRCYRATVHARAAGRPCRHCGYAVTRARQLCRRCYYTPAISALYPRESPHDYQPPPDRDWPTGPPPHPTPHRPGTAGKVAALAARYAARQELYHPEDNRGDD